MEHQTDIVNALTDAFFEIRAGETLRALESIAYAIRGIAHDTGIDIQYLEDNGLRNMVGERAEPQY